MERASAHLCSDLETSWDPCFDLRVNFILRTDVQPLSDNMVKDGKDTLWKLDVGLRTKTSIM